MARRESVNPRYPLMGDDTLSTVIREFLSKTNDELHMSSGVDIGIPRKEAPLQAVSVRKILLVSSLYDSFIFEEGGGLADALYAEYSTLKLIRAPPVISRVSTLKQALEQISSSYSSDTKSIDLVICFLRRTVGNDIWTFFESIRKIAPRMPVLLLASNTRELSTLDPRIDNALRLNIHKTRGWEQGIENIWTWPFLWQGDFSLIFAMIKSVEDRVNLSKDISNANVRVILVVEDNVQFYSSYLPIIYNLVFRLTADVMKDAATMRERVETRLKRPKILLANSYEEAMEIYSIISANMLGMITDVGFHKDGVNDETAGLALTKAVKAKTPHLPILVQSSEKSNEAEALRLGASFLLKSDKHLLSGLRDFMEISLGFGPFKFKDEEGNLVREAPTLVDFAQSLLVVPDPIINRHLEQSHFRTWFAAHNRFEIAEAIAKIETITVPYEQKKQLLLNSIFEYRRKSRATVVSEFDPEGFTYDSESAGSLQRLGSGSLGGKGHGLAFLNSIVETYHINRLFPQLSIYVPRSIILATGIFDDFMNDNNLYDIALSVESSDETIVSAFVAGTLREDIVSSLGVYLSKVNYPLSVRSSSVFEDAMDKPYAGIYDTFMLPNNNPDNAVRLAELVKAVKMVYASTYKHTAQAYEHSSGTRPEEAKMAVVIQQLAGHKHSNNQFYPTFAGVAGSYDVYAKTGSEPTRGYCTVGLGLGGTVVNGGYLARFSPGDKDIWKTTQSHYLALKLDGPTTFDPHAFEVSSEVSTLTLPITKAPSSAQSKPTGSGNLLAVNVHGVPVNYVGTGSIPIPDVDVSSVGKTPVSEIKTPVTLKQMTLDELIENDVIPLSQMVSLLFQVGSAAMSCPIEMEFAVDFEAVTNDPDKVEVKFALLQMRAMAGALKQYVPNLSMNDVPASGTTLCYSRQALGHCLNPEIKDIVFVSRAGFSPDNTREIAQQIGQITQKLHAEKRPYILLGPGRWGTASHNLGIPVTWQQICGAACIIETAFGSGNSVPSQGTHFFQNITSFDIPYFTINKEDGDVDYAWLEGQKVATTVGCAKHVALDQPLQVVVDGISRCGVVMLPERSYQVFVGQANAFLDMANLPCA